MARTFSRGYTAIPAGVRDWEIDGLPGNSEGFRFVMAPGPAWLAASGPLFTFDIKIALDGVNFQQWIHVEQPGGPVFDRLGNPSSFKLSGKWPGENDGSGGRRKLRAANLRLTLNALQAFDCDSILLETF
jgi:hypothetical protein